MRTLHVNPIRRLGVERLEDRYLMAGDVVDITIAPVETTLVAMTEPAALVATADTQSTVAATSSLERFASAEELRQWLIADALTRYAGVFGQSAYSYPYWRCCDMPNAPLGNWATTGELMTLAVLDSAASVAFTETNTQVQGVDEADLVETDGKYLYIVRGQELAIVDVQPGHDMAVLSRISTGFYWNASLYLTGDRLTLLTTSSTGTSVSVFDISDRTAPQRVQKTDVPGWVSDSRVIDGRLYLTTVNSQFCLPSPRWISDDSSATDNSSGGAVLNCWYWSPRPGHYETKEEYLARIAGQELDLVLPKMSLYGADDQLLETRAICQPSEIYRPTTEGRYALSILSFDLAGDAPGPTAAATVFGSNWANDVYATEQSIYLFDTLNGSWSPQAETRICRFNLDAAGGVTLAATGAVPGALLNQFSADEYQGYFRIATSDGGWGRSGNGVYVLAQEGEQLNVVGQVEHLTPGERIYSVRFSEDRAFVVTFRNTDPLLTIDLSDPTNPTLQGELVLPGFSNYLQLIDGHYLIGIGRDADAQSGLFAGPQISLFDVADLANPTLIERYSISTQRGDYSEAFTDFHAVSYYADEHILALPVSIYGTTADLWLFRINVGIADQDADAKQGLELVGQVDHDSAVRRSLSIGDVLYTISDTTVSASSLDDPLQMLGWLSLDNETADPPVIVPPAEVVDPPDVDPPVRIIIEPPVVVLPPVVIEWPIDPGSVLVDDPPAEVIAPPVEVATVLVGPVPADPAASEPVVADPSDVELAMTSVLVAETPVQPDSTAWELAMAAASETATSGLPAETTQAEPYFTVAPSQPGALDEPNGDATPAVEPSEPHSDAPPTDAIPAGSLASDLWGLENDWWDLSNGLPGRGSRLTRP